MQLQALIEQQAESAKERCNMERTLSDTDFGLCLNKLNRSNQQKPPESRAGINIPDYYDNEKNCYVKGGHV